MRISDWSSDVCSSDLCPTTTIGGRDAACQHNIEYRAADATANPYVAIAALIRAGLGGLADALPPPAIVAEHPNTLDEARREALGLRRLPETLEAAIAARSEEPTSELQSLMRTSYAVFCLTHKNLDPQLIM